VIKVYHDPLPTPGVSLPTPGVGNDTPGVVHENAKRRVWGARLFAIKLLRCKKNESSTQKDGSD